MSLSKRPLSKLAEKNLESNGFSQYSFDHGTFYPFRFYSKSLIKEWINHRKRVYEIQAEYGVEWQKHLEVKETDVIETVNISDRCHARLYNVSITGDTEIRIPSIVADRPEVLNAAKVLLSEVNKAWREEFGNES